MCAARRPRCGRADAPRARAAVASGPPRSWSRRIWRQRRRPRRAPGRPPPPCTPPSTHARRPADAGRASSASRSSTRRSHVYTGPQSARDQPRARPAAAQPGARRQSPVLRIGGDSTDATWWPMRGMIPPGGVSYALTNGWLRTTRALAATLGAKLILGVNLAAGRPAIAAAEARALLSGIGRRYIDALEIGNEPDRLRRVPVVPRPPRPRRSSPAAATTTSTHYIKEFARWRAALPTVPLAGPGARRADLAGGPATASSPPSRGCAIVTVHRYPLQRLPHRPAARRLSLDRRTCSATAPRAGWPQALAPYVAVAHARGAAVPRRRAELGASCCRANGRQRHVRLRAVDARHAVQPGQRRRRRRQRPHAARRRLRAVHVQPHDAAGWQAFVHPDYYGMLMFAQAFPPGAQLLPVHAPRPARSRSGPRAPPTARPASR